MNHSACIGVQNIDKYKFPSPRDFVHFFGRFGAISSISLQPQAAPCSSASSKQTEKPQANKGPVCFQGLIIFFRREDALKAIDALHNNMHGKYPLKLTLCVVRKEMLPMYVPPWQSTHEFNRESVNRVLENSMKINKEVIKKIWKAVENAESLEPFVAVVPQVNEIPNALRYLIDTTAQYVARYGRSFETAIVSKERANAIYALFMPSDNFQSVFDSFDEETLMFRLKCQTFYRWRVLSLMNGDSLSSWNLNPFQPIEGGLIFFPPPCDRGQIPVAKKPEEAALYVQLQHEMIHLLQKLKNERCMIAHASHFVLRAVSDVSQVMDVLYLSIVRRGGSAKHGLLCLYVLSDVFCNSHLLQSNFHKGLIDLLKIKIEDMYTVMMAKIRLISDEIERSSMRQKIYNVFESFEKAGFLQIRTDAVVYY